MTVVEVTPSAAPRSSPSGQTGFGDIRLVSVLHGVRPEMRRHILRFPVLPEHRVSLEMGLEDEHAWARIPELDVTAEGEDLNEALKAVFSAAHDWIAYLRDEEPALAPELADQVRYLALLEVPSYTWFKSYRLVL